MNKVEPLIKNKKQVSFGTSRQSIRMICIYEEACYAPKKNVTHRRGASYNSELPRTPNLISPDNEKSQAYQ
jgi:hypothetical protein